MYGNRPAARDDLAADLAWLRVAVHDPRLDARVVLERLVDVVAAVVDLIPGPPPGKGPDG